MKQIAQNYKSGELTVLDVPAPVCRPGGVLVRSLFSLISTGTEMMKVTEANMSMVGKARARPDQVRKVLDSVAQQGAVATYKKVMNRLDSYTPLGYSLCGVVVEVGRGADEFKVGQVVAAAGNEHALHAEYNWIPVNLCVPVPKGVSPEHAAFSTVGAIAMHGVRRAEVQLGDTACVIGLGLIGQLAVRLLIAAGVRTVGLDVIEERCRLAEKAGAVAVRRAHRRRPGGSPAGRWPNSPTGAGPTMCSWPLAARLTDRWRPLSSWRATVPGWWTSARPVWICLGTRTTTRRSTSASHGPTARAGMTTTTSSRASTTQRVMCAGPSGGTLSASLTSLPARTSRSSRSSPACSRWIRRRPSTKICPPARWTPWESCSSIRRPPPTARRPRPADCSSQAAGPSLAATAGQQLAIGFIGAGNYASSMLLPHLARLETVRLAHVATTRSLSAVNAQRRFGFATASTSADAVLDDKSLDAIFIVTRHHTHADLVCRALQTGKAVFVEKPLALTGEELERIIDVVNSTGNDRLMVGFNRRFAPMLVQLKSLFGQPGASSVDALPGERRTTRRRQLVPQRGAGRLTLRR